MTFIRKVNLVEVLKEELETQGVNVPEDLTDEQLDAWSEDQIRKYYTTHGQAEAGSIAQVAAGSPTAAAGTAKQPDIQQQLDLAQQQLASLQLRFAGQSDPAAFKAWFPGLALSKTDTAYPKAVVLCFHSSGNAEDMFTSEGTGSRRVASPLLETCRANRWKLLAAQLPGRGLRAHEPQISNLQTVAQQLLPLVAPELLSAGGRYALVGHSMGCWAAYELMLLLLQAGFPEPAVACFSAMPWPDIPMQQRPWRQQKTLAEAAFQEECMCWDINEVVFSAGLWDIYHPMLRADFKLFDEYLPSSSSSRTASTSHHPCSGNRWFCGRTNGTVDDSSAAKQPPFNFPMRLFYGSQDRRVKQEMVQRWTEYTRANCKLSCIQGNHLFPLQPAAKSEWLQEVAGALSSALS